ncbi:MAG: Uncharacterised protein [Prochlorococcus marinus str. MIT 9313]|nr:MAG: Uncharacterised protein [Prochlorococcus marinus str. MIT 9313]
MELRQTIRQGLHPPSSSHHLVRMIQAPDHQATDRYHHEVAISVVLSSLYATRLQQSGFGQQTYEYKSVHLS